MKRFILLMLPVVMISGCGDSGTPESPEAPETAQATLERLVSETKKGNAAVVWETLPATYQTDVNQLVQGFGNNMDQKSWNAIIDIVKQVHELLDKQAKFIANSKMATEAGSDQDPADTEKNIKSVATLLKALLDQVDSLEKLKTFDGEKFFAGGGTTILKQAIGLMDVIKDSGAPGVDLSALDAEMTVETEKSDAETATLKVTVNGESQEEVWVLHEGKWIPQEMVTDWPTMMNGANGALASLPQESAPIAAQLGLFGPMIKTALKPLQDAKTQEEFDAAMEQVKGMASMIPGFGSGGSPFGPPSGGDFGSDGPGIEFEIDGSEPEGDLIPSPQEGDK